MKSETMIKRVAKAIQDEMPGWLAEDGTVDDRALAVAAIKAMRQPTPRMRAAAQGIASYRDIYPAMIDAALSEESDDGIAAA